MSAAAAAHPRSSMLYHLVIIGDGSADKLSRYQFCCFGCQQPDPEKPGPNGDRVALLWRYKRPSGSIMVPEAKSDGIRGGQIRNSRLC